MTVAVPNHEAERLTALKSYEVWGSEPELPYEQITELAAQICGCPAALVSFMDDKHLWSKARYGLPPRKGPVPREMFMCSTAARGSDLLVVGDLSKDKRFAELPIVATPPHIRFYCGMPLINPEGHSLGSLCVLDFRPRELTFEQGDAVRRLGRQIVTLLELRRSLLQLDRVHRELQEEYGKLEEKCEKSDRLLYNMLPAAVANDVKAGKRAAASFHDSVTILFADFESFTKLAEVMEPSELIEQLDEYFSAFDEIAERNRLEMLKTIGDAYMCAGGIPDDNKTHLVDCCLAALEMQQLINRMNTEREKLHLPVWQVRIGIHTGPVIAGVVGRRKYTYDVWGDAVNVAARMESAGAAGKINVSEAVYHQVTDLFEFEPRGNVEVKNKGPLGMYFLLRIKSAFARDDRGYQPNEAFFAARTPLLNNFKSVA